MKYNSWTGILRILGAGWATYVWPGGTVLSAEPECCNMASPSVSTPGSSQGSRGGMFFRDQLVMTCRPSIMFGLDEKYSEGNGDPQ